MDFESPASGLNLWCFCGFVLLFYSGYSLVEALRNRVIGDSEKERESTLLACLWPVCIHFSLQLLTIYDLIDTVLFFTCSISFILGEATHLLIGTPILKVIAYVDVGRGNNLRRVIWLENDSVSIGAVRSKIAQSVGISPASRLIIKMSSGGLCPDDDEDDDDDDDDEAYMSEDDEGEREFVTSLINQKPLSLLSSQDAIHHSPNSFFGWECVTLFTLVKYDRFDGLGISQRNSFIEQIRTAYDSPNRERVGSDGVWFSDAFANLATLGRTSSSASNNHESPKKGRPIPRERGPTGFIVSPPPRYMTGEEVLFDTDSGEDEAFNSPDSHDSNPNFYKDTIDFTWRDVKDGEYTQQLRAAAAKKNKSKSKNQSQNSGGDNRHNTPTTARNASKGIADRTPSRSPGTPSVFPGMDPDTHNGPHSLSASLMKLVQTSAASVKRQSTAVGGSSDHKEGSHMRTYLYNILCLSILVVIIAVGYSVVTSTFAYNTFLTSINDNSYDSPVFHFDSESDDVKGSVYRRFRSIHHDFVNACRDQDGWRTLRKTVDTMVEVKESDSGWPHYIKTTATVRAKPSELFDMFTWKHFDDTQRRVDPFYESSEMLQELRKGKQALVFRRIMKRPLVFPKRLFVGALLAKVESTSGFEVSHSTGQVSVSKNTTMHSIVNMKCGNECNPNTDETFVLGFQDFISWYVDMGDGTTTLVTVMRMDLGKDIPRWAFLSTAGLVSVQAMKSIRSLVAERRKRKLRQS